MSKPHQLTLRRRIRAVFEPLPIRLALFLIPRLPRRGVMWLARAAGRLAWWLARRDRRIAMANLELAYGDSLSPLEKQGIVRQAFTNFVLTGLDYFWFSKDRERRLDRWVVVDDSLQRWMRPGALLAVTAHLGNWEILGWVTARHSLLLASVAKPIKNLRVDAIINRVRSQSGQQIIPRSGALRPLTRVLKNGGTVALVLDQDTLPSDGGLFVPFFGVPVCIAGAAAGLALKLKVPIVFAFGVCGVDGHYRCYSSGSLMPEDVAGMSTKEVTIRITAMLEQEIRRDPGRWLWTYKRWKRRMPGFDVSRYPFYADC